MTTLYKNFVTVQFLSASSQSVETRITALNRQEPEKERDRHK